MAATYTSTLPTDKDKVRFLIQDTVVATAMLQDEEITAMLGIYGTYKSTAVACCEVLSAKFAGEAESKKIGNLTIDFRDKATKYAKLAILLRSQTMKFVLPYLGGQSQSDKETNQLDADNVQPAFRRGIMKQKTPDLTPEDDD